MVLRDALFAPTLWSLGAVMLLAVVVFFYANARLNTKLRTAAFALAGLVVLWWVVARMVVTPTEAAMDGTSAAVDAVVERDKPKLASLLAPDASLSSLNRDDIATLLPQYADEFGLKRVLITGSNVDERESRVTVNIAVFSQHENAKKFFGESLRSEWQFDWAKQPDGSWKIARITPIKVGEANVAEVADQYFGRQR